MNKKGLRSQDQKKLSPSPKDQPSKKQNRKSENPVRVPPPTELCSDLRCANSWICKNPACRASRSNEDTFCKRCSCCVCHLYDDNKDPSLWLECTSEPAEEDSCGLSCHIECALQHKKVGVVDLGQLMQLDGSYCCFSCGKVSGILGYWKKQLSIAKDSRRVDLLCYRIFLSYRLLEGTLKFRELHKVVEEAKSKLETEVGPVNGVSAQMARGIVGRLSVCGDVQSLCSLAIEKADEWLASESSSLQKSQGSEDILHKNSNSVQNGKKENPETGESSAGVVVSDSRFKVRDLGKILELAWAREHGCLDEFCGVEAENCCEVSNIVKHETMEDPQPTVSRQLDLNVTSVPDLNEEITPPIEFSLDEQNGYTMGPTVEADDAVSHEVVRNGAIRPHGSGDSHNWTNRQNGERPAVDSDVQVCRKRAASRNQVSHDSDSTLINGSTFQFRNGSGSLDENFEYCVKIIRWLECEGHITMEFRLKLLTWFSLRSSEQECRVVNTFIQTLIDDPSSLGGQLVDTFSDIISTKKPRNGFCSKIWH